MTTEDIGRRGIA